MSQSIDTGDISMSNNNEITIRAWKNKSFRASLQASDLASLPAHPAGGTELTEGELDTMLGGVKDQSTTGSFLDMCSYDFYCFTVQYMCY